MRGFIGASYTRPKLRRAFLQVLVVRGDLHDYSRRFTPRLTSELLVANPREFVGLVSLITGSPARQLVWVIHGMSLLKSN